jgi:hypothetical protein
MDALKKKLAFDLLSEHLEDLMDSCFTVIDELVFVEDDNIELYNVEIHPDENTSDFIVNVIWACLTDPKEASWEQMGYEYFRKAANYMDEWEYAGSIVSDMMCQIIEEHNPLEILEEELSKEELSELLQYASEPVMMDDIDYERNNFFFGVNGACNILNEPTK